MKFKDIHRLERVYYENIWTLLNTLRTFKDKPVDFDTVRELLDNAIADNESIIIIYKNLGELYNEISIRFTELGKELKDLRDNLEEWKDEINDKIDELNNYIMTLIREIESRLDAIEERLNDIEDAISILPEIFMLSVAVTHNENSEQIYTPDQTYEEVAAALAIGKPVVLRLYYPDPNDPDYREDNFYLCDNWWTDGELSFPAGNHQILDAIATGDYGFYYRYTVYYYYPDGTFEASNILEHFVSRKRVQDVTYENSVYTIPLQAAIFYGNAQSPVDLRFISGSDSNRVEEREEVISTKVTGTGLTARYEFKTPTKTFTASSATAYPTYTEV